MMQAALVTFDVDWAPEWAIKFCADLCANAGVKATFFATHASPFLTELATDPRFEVGIHPNFLPRSSHGDSTEAILRTCLTFAPNARSMRTHSLVQSSPIFDTVGTHFPQIQTDMSLFLPFHAGLQPVDYFIGSDLRRMVRLPYHWEDDVAATWPGWDWEAEPVWGDGLAAVDFHPILVALNMASLSSYRGLKHRLAGRPLTDVSREDVAPLMQPGAGAAVYLQRLLEGLDRPAVTATEATAQWLTQPGVAASFRAVHAL
jgi:hypothetical protein